MNPICYTVRGGPCLRSAAVEAENTTLTAAPSSKSILGPPFDVIVALVRGVFSESSKETCAVSPYAIA